MRAGRNPTAPIVGDELSHVLRFIEEFRNIDSLDIIRRRIGCVKPLRRRGRPLLQLFARFTQCPIPPRNEDVRSSRYSIPAVQQNGFNSLAASDASLMQYIIFETDIVDRSQFGENANIFGSSANKGLYRHLAAPLAGRADETLTWNTRGKPHG